MPESMQEVNVSVAVRIRPLLPKERLASEQSCVRIIPSANQLVLGKDRAFTFDCILPSKTSQDEVYQRCVASLVRSCFEGYNATVFAYGQTGSGKTYTVGGGTLSSQTEDEFGVLPRAIKHMYQYMKQTGNDRDYSVKVSFIEIYCEELRDLLDLETSAKDMHIREDDKGNTVIIGASEVQCDSEEEVLACVDRGSSFRHTGSTQMNEASSRSHSVFTLYLEQRWADSNVSTPVERPERGRHLNEDGEIIEDGDMQHYMCAKFHFVDLAGSERANRTGNVGGRLKESVHINSGLLALGNVISALGDLKKKVSHIPYRDSKITRLLKDSLGGNAQTLMFCCVSPATSNFDESLNSLKYANRARNIKNKPVVNRDPQSIRFEEMQSEIKALREELSRQRTSIMTLGGDSDVRLAVQEAGEIKQMEDKIARLQTECSHYKMIAEEAYKQLTDMSKQDILSKSQQSRLQDWMELVEEMQNKVPSTLSTPALWENQTIAKLQVELDQCKKDLRSDEEIFAEKARELNQLQERLGQMDAANAESARLYEEAMDRQKQQQEQLVAQQLQIEELTAKLKENETDLDDMESCEELEEDDIQPGEAPTSRRRAKSVPAHMLGNRSARTEPPTARKIHTSPALFSLERVMANFRARSQLLLSRVEDCDDVNQQHFSDDSMDAADLMEDDEPAEDKKITFQRNTSSRGTYRVARPRFSRAQKSTESMDNGEGPLQRSGHLPEIWQTDDAKWSMRKSIEGNINGKRRGSKVVRIVGADPQNRLDVSRLRNSTEIQKRRLKQTELDVRQSTQKMRDLSINIRMKEQLIRELVKTGQESHEMNKKYEDKIKALEKEKQSVCAELGSLQKAMQEIDSKGQHDRTEKDKLHSDFRRKMEAAKTRISSLVKKQKETEKMASITSTNDKRVHDLEQAVDKMRQQHESLQKRLKDESERKSKLEKDMAREQQRVRELEQRHQQQQKVLKVKTEEVAAIQRKMRSNSHRQSSEEQLKFDEQKRWLDTEIEKVLEQRLKMEDIHKELERREDIVAKKEAMLAEKSELEMKKLRSSQMLSKDLLSVATKLESVDRIINEKSREMISTPREKQALLKDELQQLLQGRDRLTQHRDSLDAKLKERAVLSPQEERRLIEITEGIDALDAAIEYKNDNIANKQQDLRQSVSLAQNEGNLLLKLTALSAGDTKVLLTRYFEKVIDLREAERRKDHECSELEVKVDEQEHQIQQLEASLQQVAMETDRKLTQHQHEAECKIQALMHQLMEAERGSSQSVSNPDVPEMQAKLAQLEKDLYYYKKTSRELKRRLRELLATSATPDPDRNSDKDPDSVENMADGPKSTRSNASARPSSHCTTNRENSDPLTPRKSQSSRTPSHTTRSNVKSSADFESRASHIREGVTPVRISRKDLRRMSDEEVCMRLSQAHTNDPSDSLEVSKSQCS